MEATFIETKKGDGFKIVVDGKWFYTSKKELFKAIKRRTGCKFRTIKEEETVIDGEAHSLSSYSKALKGGDENGNNNRRPSKQVFAGV